MTAQDRGRFVWHELLTSDPAAAERFYRAITGWGIQPYPGQTTYRMWTNKGTPLGGVMVLPEEAKKMGSPPHWEPYISVPDVDATVQQATSLGGRVYVQSQDIPNVGRFAILADPQGAVFSIFKGAGQPLGHEGPAEVGEFSWHELATTDWQGAWNFYEALFGWVKMGSMEMGPAGTYQMYGREGVMLGGMYNDTNVPKAANWLSYVLIPSVDAAVSKVTGSGGKILHGPADVPGGDRIAMCVDPQGAAFALHSRAAAAAKPPAATPAAKPKAASKPKAVVRAKAAKPKALAKSKVKAKVKAKLKKKAAAKKRPKSKARPRVKPRAKATKKKSPKRRAGARRHR
ncbi:MAG: VOC family protein [Gemmatimonadales bacterium]